jgi:hypothetical protein
MKKNIPGIILSKIFGILIFFVILYFLNRLQIDNEMFVLWSGFLNNNAALFVVMSLVFMIAEIFFALNFPFNFPGPIFAAFASLMLVKFIFKIFVVIDSALKLNISSIFSSMMFMIYPLVFVLVIAGGYVTIFSKIKCKSKSKSKKTDKHKGCCDDKSWDEVGEDCKKGLSSLFRKIADSIDKEKEQ